MPNTKTSKQIIAVQCSCKKVYLNMKKKKTIENEMIIHIWFWVFKTINDGIFLARCHIWASFFSFLSNHCFQRLIEIGKMKCVAVVIIRLKSSNAKQCYNKKLWKEEERSYEAIVTASSENEAKKKTAPK